MRRFLHAVIILAGVIPWAIAMTCMWVVVRSAILAERIAPNTGMGNCWSFALVRWRTHGGYLAIRPAPRPVSFIPHVIWFRELLPGTDLAQTRPLVRDTRWWHAVRAFYFHYRVAHIEHRPGDTQPAPLGD